METKKLYFNECHLAGAQYHDLDEVFDELRCGSRLELERDKENRFDPYAVAVVYHRSEDPDDAFLIGYIPRGENTVIANLLDMGWGDIFMCRISRIDPEAHYERQIHLKISIRRRDLVEMGHKKSLINTHETTENQ